MTNVLIEWIGFGFITIIRPDSILGFQEPGMRNLGNGMKVAEHIPNFGTPNPALLTFVLVAIILMFEPDQSLPERSLFLPKIAAAGDAQTPVRAKPMPPARDPKIAIEEEYKLALDRGTVQALELFITRHSDDPLADKARGELQRLRR